MYFRYFKYYLPLEKGGDRYFEQTWIPSTQECLVPSLFELVLEKKIFKFGQWFSTISLLSPFGKYRVALHLNNFESPSLKNVLCQVWFKLSPAVLEKRIFKFRQCIFAISLSSPFEKGIGPSLEPICILIQRMLCFQVWLKLVQWFWRRFLNFINVFSLSLLSLHGKGRCPSFELHTWIHFT